MLTYQGSGQTASAISSNSVAEIPTHEWRQQVSPAPAVSPSRPDPNAGQRLQNPPSRRAGLMQSAPTKLRCDKPARGCRASYHSALDSVPQYPLVLDLAPINFHHVLGGPERIGDLPVLAALGCALDDEVFAFAGPSTGCFLSNHNCLL